MSIAKRKADHIELCAEGDVAFRHKTTLLEQVEFIHDALPELHADRLDTSIELFGKQLRAPLFIAAMTGGTERAAEINAELAAVAQARGIGFGLGSQRPMLKGHDEGYTVRDVAPDVLLLGNLAAVQARDVEVSAVAELAERVGADAMCLHLNPAMELIQPGGDRDFGGLVETLRTYAQQLPVPVIAKETGCGIGPAAAAKLAGAGIKHVDVSGAGGTSWVAVETERATGVARSLGATLRDWGVPTAAAVAYAARARPRFETVIATGGIKTGLDVARAIALGASAAGIARPVLQAQQQGGRDAVDQLLDLVERELRATMLLVGAANLDALRMCNYVPGAELARWLVVP